MSVELKTKGEVLTAYLSGEIDHHRAPEMRRAIDGSLETEMPSLLVLDFSGVTFMDSSGIGLVMGRYGKISKSGAALHISGASPQIRRLLTLGGIERLCSIDKCEGD